MGWNKEILEERGWDKKRYGRMGWDRKGISRYNLEGKRWEGRGLGKGREGTGEEGQCIVKVC